MPFRPELLKRIEEHAKSRGESLGDWIEKAALLRLERHDERPPRDAKDVEQRRPQPFAPGSEAVR